MSRTDADVEGFFNDLDTDETDVLLDLVAGLDPLAQEDGKPKYTGDQITLIGRFQQFVTDYPVDDEDEDEDFEDETDDENSEDIAGTGETDEEYVARKAAENKTDEGRPDQALPDTDNYTRTIDPGQNPGWSPSLSDEALRQERERNPGWGSNQ